VTAGHLDIRPFGPADDVEAELDLRRRAFGPIAAGDRPRWSAGVQASVDAGQIFGVFDGSRLVASARYFAMRQWWLGRSIPMAGVAGVKVAPEERGRGVGRALMLEMLAGLEDRGFLLSTLYPATARLYRALGWEIAGGKYETVLPTADLAALLPPDPLVGGDDAGDQPSAPGLRRATVHDGAAVVEALGAVHRTLRDSGPATETPDLVSAWLDDHDHFAYLADDGFLSYRWASHRSPTGGHELQVDFVAAASAGTARTFWQILSSHAANADTIRACLSPGDAIDWLTREPVVAIRRRDPWMLRIIDAAAAIGARGYPPSAALSVQLDLADDVMPGNAGRWALEISGGAGKLTRPAGRERGSALRLGPRGFAALFAGVPVATLRLTGLAAGGGQEADGELDAAFACGPVHMLFEF
jgi:predicted acetyltransferase